jgi:hypothetical protein
MKTIKAITIALLSFFLSSSVSAQLVIRDKEYYKGGPKFKFKNKDDFPEIKMKDYSGYSKTKGTFYGYGRETFYHHHRKNKVHYYRGGLPY